uniref:metallophosphoesterase family protein n=1 Tax=uncultured Draconibacterium sp. TaxID=1573823 RepID=UPI003217EEB2
MKKMIGLFGVIMIMFSLLSWDQGNISTPVLRFNDDGKFKIVQFTDIHYQYNSYRSDSALAIVNTVIKNEKPNLVVFSGDVVCSKNTRLAWESFSKVMIEAKVPWAAVLGNHDIEYEMTGKQIMEQIEGLPYNLTVNGPDNISGNGNYVIEIRSSNNSKTAAVLYFLDSHSGLNSEAGLGSYDWVKFDQIEWYRNKSSILTKTNGGNPFPALAFFHIPLPEYEEVLNISTTVGEQKESVCSPKINSGLYTAMLESKDVMGTFVGHDHNNDYIGCLRNICLAYGNVTGRQCYGDIGRGARVIELYEGERKFDTWILKMYECNRDLDTWKPIDIKERKYFVTYPDSFIGN